MLSKLSGAFEHTVVFVFFLFLFMAGALIASKYIIGPVIRPATQSLGATLEAA